MSIPISPKETDPFPKLASVVNGLLNKVALSNIDLLQIQLQADRDQSDPKDLPEFYSYGRLTAGYFVLAVEVQAAMKFLALLEEREAPETAFRQMSPLTRLQLTALAAEHRFAVDASVLTAIPYIVSTPKKR